MNRSSHRSLGSTVAWNWKQLGSRAALSQLTALGYLPFGITGPLLIDRARLGGSALAWLFVGIVGQLVVMAGLWIGQRLVQPHVARSVRPVVTIMTIMISVSIRAVMIAWIPFALGLSPTFEIGYRLAAALLPQSGFIILIALVVSTYAYHGQLNAELAVQERQLEASNATMRESIAGMQQELAEELQRTLRPILADLDRSLERAAGGAQLEEVRDSIHEVVETEVRPLSHRLAMVAQEESPRFADVVEHRGRAVPLPKRPALRSLINPGGISLVVLLLATAQAFRALHMPALLLFPVVYVLVTWVIMRAFTAVLGAWSPPLWFGIAITGGLVGGSMCASLLILGAVGFPVPGSVMASAFVGGALIGVMSSTYLAVNAKRTTTEAQLRSAVDELQLNLSVLRQHAFVIRRQLGYVLHGSVQGALHAAVMRLASGASPTPERIDEIRLDIASAAARLDDPFEATVAVERTLADIAELWDNSCDVTWDIDNATVHLLESSPISAVSLTEIVREGVANAVRHGKASRVETLVLDRPGGVEIIMTDDGRMRADAEPGLGSRMMDEMCVSWYRESVGEGTRLRAVIALSAPTR